MQLPHTELPREVQSLAGVSKLPRTHAPCAKAGWLPSLPGVPGGVLTGCPLIQNKSSSLSPRIWKPGFSSSSLAMSLDLHTLGCSHNSLEPL